MSTLLFELGCEEIPARFINSLLADLSKQVEDRLKTLRLGSPNLSIKTLGTYRRLTLIINNIAAEQAAEEASLILGPPKQAAQDPDGNWTTAAIGWAKKNGIDVSEIQFQEDLKGRLCCALMKEAQSAKSATELLPELLADAVKSLQLPIAMRWGTETIPFIRTIQWICCLLDSSTIPVSLYDVTASNHSRGHRFLSQADHSEGDTLSIPNATDYESILEKANVTVNQAKRQEQIQNFVSQHNGGADINPGLLNEVVYLVEQASPLMGSYDGKFLSLPSEVLEECMAKHQKYFPVYNNGSLSNQFIVVADNITNDNKDIILKGNEKVLSARLEDAMFFWNEDQKKTLAQHAEGLKKVIYQQNLGSIWDKTQRLAVVMDNLAKHLNQDSSTFINAAKLSKADLTTQMVYEFASLQGTMGAYYAKEENLPPELINALHEQYKPLNEKSALPESLVGACLAIADRLDLIVACFENDNIPTSSKDPWGIRKAMIAITRICLSHPELVDLDIVNLLDLSYQSYPSPIQNKAKLNEIIAFYKPRLKHVFLDSHKFESPISPDMVDACMEVSLNPARIYNVLTQLSQLKAQNSESYKQLVDTAVRVGRLNETPVHKEINTSLFQAKIEGDVYTQLSSLESSPKVNDLSTLSLSLESYFDQVLVNDKDPKVKENRLALIGRLDNLFKQSFQAEKLVV